MAIELIAEDGGPRKHRDLLGKLLESTGGCVRVASAYVTDDDLLLGIKNRDVRLLAPLVQMDVVSGATSLRCLRSLVASDVKCRCLIEGPRFHAKVYIFGDEFAIVTSANMTTNAFDFNIEVGVQVTGSPVQKLIAWFDSFWKKASSLDLPKIAQWEAETEGLRRAYAELRRKAGKKPKLPNETMPSVASPAKLRDLAEKASGFFVCNTNRRHSPNGEDERLMRRTRFATVWTSFKYPSHMERVKQGDAIFMFARGVGIIGVGFAEKGHAVLAPGDPSRITTEFSKDEEWRVLVDSWLAWAENDEDAYSWKMPNASFLDVTGDNYRDFRNAVFKHFLRES